MALSEQAELVARLLFQGLSHKGQGQVVRDEMLLKLLDVVEPGLTKRERDREIDVVMELAGRPSSADSLDLVAFLQWAVVKVPGGEPSSPTSEGFRLALRSTPLLQWFQPLLRAVLEADPARYELSARLDDRAAIDARLAEKIAPEAVARLRKVAERLSHTRPGYGSFSAQLESFLPQILIQGLWNACAVASSATLSVARHGVVSDTALLEAFVTCVSDDFRSAAHLAIRMFSAPGSESDVVSLEALERVAECSWTCERWAVQGLPPSARRKVDSDAARSVEAEWKRNEVEVVSGMKASLGMEEDDESLPLSRVLEWAESHPLQSVGFLSMLRTALFVDLGVRPESLSAEGRVIGECFEAFDAARPGKRFDEWYCIASPWWRVWCSVSGFSTRGDYKGRLVSTDPLTPDVIDNSALVIKKNCRILKTGLNHGAVNDFVLVPYRTWKALFAWYGATVTLMRHVQPIQLYAPLIRAPRRAASPPRKLNHTGGLVGGMVASISGWGAAASAPSVSEVSGGRTFARQARVALPPKSGGELPMELELYPLVLGVRSLAAGTAKVTPAGSILLFSKSTLVRELLISLCDHLAVSPDRSRLWYRSEPNNDGPTAGFAPAVSGSGGMWEPLRDPEATLEGLELADFGEILVEVKSAQSGWPWHGWDATESTPVAQTSRETQLARVHSGEGVAPDGGPIAGVTYRRHGDVGLANLGNSCYMASALQCLTHTPHLTEYFLRGKHLYDLNLGAKDGLEGRLTLAYASLVQDLWLGRDSSASPRAFKALVAEARPAFSGFSQQDAQELLDVVMTTMGEELNRNTSKPYIEMPDSDGRPDPEVAEEWWLGHLQRERSVLVSLFNGQYKSTLTCAHCGEASARFEPFNQLQLPLPDPAVRRVLLCLHNPMEAKPPLLVGLVMPRAGACDLVGNAAVLWNEGRWVTGSEDWEALAAVSKRHSRVNVGPSSPQQVVSRSAIHERLHSCVGKRCPDAAAALDGSVWFRCLSPSLSPECVMLAMGPAFGENCPTEVPTAKKLSHLPDTATERLHAFHSPSVEALTRMTQLVCGTMVVTPGAMVTITRDEPEVGAVEATTARASTSPARVAGVVRRVAGDSLELTLRDGSHGTVPLSRALPSLTPPQTVSLRARRLVESTRYFVNSVEYQPFGIPVMSRIAPDSMTGYDLYCVVHRLLHRWVRGSRPLPPRPWVYSRVRPASVEGMELPDDAEWGSPGDCLWVDPDEETGIARLSELDVMKAWGFALKRQPGIQSGGRAADRLLEDVSGTLILPGVSKSMGVVRRLFVATAGAGEGEMEGDVDVHFGKAYLVDRSHRLDASDVASTFFLGHGGEVILPQELLWVDIDPELTRSSPHGDTSATITSDPSVSRSLALLDKPLSVLQCLGAFCQEEALDDERFCRRCSRSSSSGDVTLRKHSKKIDLWRGPPFLVIQLKRFQHTQFSHRKLENAVTFPLKGLNIAPFLSNPRVSQPPPDLSAWEWLGGRRAPSSAGAAPMADTLRPSTPVHPLLSRKDDERVGARESLFEGVPLLLSREDTEYDLYAVVNHFGRIGAGHYVAYVKSEADGQWRAFNDARVSLMDDRDVQSSSAYLLFYARRDIQRRDIDELFPTLSGAVPVDVSKLQQASGSKCQVM
jgi:ubiquitin C-terminal hydrolase